MEYRKNPIKAIRQHCLGCSNGSMDEVANCRVVNCEIYPFRFGKNPYREKRVLTEAQKKAVADRLKKAREAKTAHIQQ